LDITSPTLYLARIEGVAGSAPAATFRAETLGVRIALFHTTLPEAGRKPGGVEIAVHRLANELARGGGDDVTVFSLSPRPPDALYAHRRLFPSAPWLRDGRIGRLFLLPLLLNFVKFGQREVIHLHGDDWFFFRRKSPTVRTLHGSALREARHATSLKRKAAQYCVYPLERISARLATVAVAVGRDAAEIYGLSRTVDNGVDLERFHSGEKSARPSVLYIGTWEGRKRGRWLHELFVNRILPRVPEAELLFVSDRCDPHPSVRAIRFPDDEALASLYREAWVFAYPSTYEGFGIPYVEALASGTAIVSSPNGGASQVLDEGSYGIITGDAEFAGQVIDLLGNAGKREAFEVRGRSRAEMFTWRKVADRHREVYRLAVALRR
jgi:phosphatidylinositol alpha-mannosyltransferase